MFNIEQMKKYKDFCLLGALIATVASCGCNFLNALTFNPENYTSGGVFSAISGIIGYISLGCFLLVAVCSFFIFLNERTMLELVTAGSWAAYAGMSLVYKIANLVLENDGYSFETLNNIILIASGISFFLLGIVHIVRAKKTKNTIILLMGVAALLSSVVAGVVVGLVSGFIGDVKVITIISTVVYSFSSILPPLFFFVEAKAERD